MVLALVGGFRWRRGNNIKTTIMRMHERQAQNRTTPTTPTLIYREAIKYTKETRARDSHKAPRAGRSTVDRLPPPLPRRRQAKRLRTIQLNDGFFLRSRSFCFSGRPTSRRPEARCCAASLALLVDFACACLTAFTSIFLKNGAFFRISGSTMKRTWLPRKKQLRREGSGWAGGQIW